MGVDIKFISHKVNVLSRVDDCIKDAQNEMKESAIEWVQEKMLYGYHDPHGEDGHTEIYDTGYLSEKSLRSEVKRDSQNTYTISVGSTADYAVYVHNGTHKLKGRPFITDALEGSKDKQRAIYEKYLKRMNNK